MNKQKPFCYHDGRNIVSKEFSDHSDVFPLYREPFLDRDDLLCGIELQKKEIYRLREQCAKDTAKIAELERASTAWQLIDYAPVGKWVLVCNDGIVDIARLHNTERWFNTRDIECSLVTHWMPIPAPPKAQEEIK